MFGSFDSCFIKIEIKNRFFIVRRAVHTKRRSHRKRNQNPKAGYYILLLTNNHIIFTIEIENVCIE